MSSAADSEHCAIESMPPWERYLLYMERAKAKNEQVMTYEEWQRSIEEKPKEDECSSSSS